MRYLTNSILILCLTNCSPKTMNHSIGKVLSRIFDRTELTIAPPLENDNSCEGKGKTLYVNTHIQKMHVCILGKKIETFDVSLGSSGLGKTKSGDRKTPIGVYGLGKPRKSRTKYYKFMHVQYPTSTQRASGYTGGDVGVHGPPVRGDSFKKRNSRNWGAGCIVLGSDEETEKVADHVSKNNISKIIILN